MRIDLGDLVPALKDWTLCIDEAGDDCVISVELPDWARELSDEKRLYIALYLAARKTMDYRIAAALHIHFVKSREKAVVRPELLIKALREARVVSRISRRIEEESVYAWKAVLYRGILYAKTLLEAKKRR